MKSILSLLVFMISFSTRAELLIEPLAGLNFSGILEPENSSEMDVRGVSWGGRLGFQKFGFQMGLDYMSANLDVEDESENLKTNEFGAFVGFEFPVFLRIYAGYIFSATGELDTTEYQKGSGSKFGIGFTGLPLIDINFEYRRMTFGEYELQGLANPVESDTSFHSYFIGLSLPILI